MHLEEINDHSIYKYIPAGMSKGTVPGHFDQFGSHALVTPHADHGFNFFSIFSKKKSCHCRIGRFKWYSKHIWPSCHLWSFLFFVWLYYCTIQINSAGGVTCDMTAEILNSVSSRICCDIPFFSAGRKFVSILILIFSAGFFFIS